VSEGRGPIRWLHWLSISRPSANQSVDWEIEHHLEEASDRLVEAGWSPEDARREAERRFGVRRYGPALRRIERERIMVARGSRWLDFVIESFVGAARGARRDRGFTIGVVVTLALGIGANATMYGIVDRLLLRAPDHVEDPGAVRRVFVERPFVGQLTTTSTITVPDATDLQAHSGFEAVAIYSRGVRTMGLGEGALRVWTSLTSHDFFPLLGVEPRLGRFYAEADDRVGAEPTAVISQELWERTFASDPSVLGDALELSGRSYTIVGIAPAGLTGVDLAPVDVWIPLRVAGDEECASDRGCYWVQAAVRLATGVSQESAEAEATALHVNGRRDDIQDGSYPRESRVLLGPLIAARGPNAASEGMVAAWLTGVSLVVLLIACANVANLLLAQGAKRRREVAVRLALGVSRAELVGQMVLQNVLLAGLGGALALVISRWGGAFIRETLLPGVLFPDATNGRVVAVTVAATLFAGFIAALGPSLQATRGRLTATLTESRPGVSSRRSRARTLLTIAQAAMSVVLLVGAGLFVRSLGELRGLDLGLDVDRLQLVRLELMGSALPGEIPGQQTDRAEQARIYRLAVERLRTVPEVEAAAVTSSPFQWGFGTNLRVPGLDSIPSLPGGGPYYYSVTPGYFDVVGVRIIRGRPLETSDGDGAARVAVISETMARSLWPEGDGLGECLMVGRGAEECTTVVGIAEDAARGGFQDEPFMAYYMPFAQRNDAPQGIYVRTKGKSADAVGVVSAALRGFEPGVRYPEVRSLREILEPDARSWTLGATMFTVFGLLALVVAAIGLYSVLAFDVAQRTRELGIRTALGARKDRLLTDVVLDGTRLAGLGVALGLSVAWLAAPYAQGLLFQVSPREPAVLGIVALVLLAVSALASLAPGLRATRVDPVIALKSD
jgi:predicted permease